MVPGDALHLLATRAACAGAAEGEVKGEYANSQDRNWRLSWYRIGAVPIKDTM